MHFLKSVKLSKHDFNNRGAAWIVFNNLSILHFFSFLSRLVLLCSHRLLKFGTDGFNAVRVPDDNISVRAHCNPAFAWVQVEDFGSVCRCDCHKLVFIHLPHGLEDRSGCLEWWTKITLKTGTQGTHIYMVIPHHSFVPDKTHSLFYSIGSFWDHGEVIFTNSFLGSAVCAVSTANHLEVPTV